jgi:hypothetical protein
LRCVQCPNSNTEPISLSLGLSEKPGCKTKMPCGVYPLIDISIEDVFWGMCVFYLIDIIE